jgi:uncharacterized small protein (DUF1192 family)
MSRYAKAVIRYIADEYGLRPEQIRGRDRKADVAYPRQEVMFMLCQSNMSLNQIVSVLDNRDHTTIIHGKKRVEKVASKERLAELIQKSHELLESHGIAPISGSQNRVADVSLVVENAAQQVADLKRENAILRTEVKALKQERDRLTIWINAQPRALKRADRAYGVFALRQEIDDLKAELAHEKEERALDRERWFKTRDQTLFLEHQT